jgi:hypothetical protein
MILLLKLKRPLQVHDEFNDPIAALHDSGAYIPPISLQTTEKRRSYNGEEECSIFF